jgi:phosphatidate cytidylyltransferase
MLRRAIFGIIYVAIMWFGTSSSETTFRLLFTILGVISLYEMSRLRKEKTKFLAFAYVLIPFILVQFFGITDKNYPQRPFDSSYILLMLILTWAFDTFAYLTGIKFGKHKIMPSVSPKKSWEGFFGGFIFTLLATYFSTYFFQSVFQSVKEIHLFLISITIPFTATLGDFIESYYKRQAGVKDSSNLIPGHGGMLDRMDAFMITIPTIYLIINLI